MATSSPPYALLNTESSSSSIVSSSPSSTSSYCGWLLYLVGCLISFSFLSLSVALVVIASLQEENEATKNGIPQYVAMPTLVLSLLWLYELEGGQAPLVALVSASPGYTRHHALSQKNIELVRDGVNIER